jgi:hypothetical protein
MPTCDGCTNLPKICLTALKIQSGAQKMPSAPKNLISSYPTARDRQRYLKCKKGNGVSRYRFSRVTHVPRAITIKRR